MVLHNKIAYITRICKSLHNVGPYRLLGHGRMPKSTLIRKLESGDRNIYREFTAYRCYNGKPVASIQRRREMEFEMLFVP